MRIVFMGTPDFAVASLRKLIENGCEVVAVVTAPDKPSGRGLEMNETPVKKYAVSQNVPVLQPEKLKNPEFLEQLRNFNADLQVVVAFRMLPEVVWNMPPKGTFNLHGSILPQYRGAAPINWAVINGDTVTGVTTFFIKQEIDTGNIIFVDKEPIYPHDNAGTVHDRLMERGADLVLKTVKAIEIGDYPQLPQHSDDELRPAPKIFKETCEINWSQPAEKVQNFIRGLSPYPAAWTTLAGKTCKVYLSEMTDTDAPDLEAGGMQTDNKTFLAFKCADKLLRIKELQLEGKKRMNVEDFLRGFRL
ncbi:methionyl-tRNA formyltransferase [Emticicia sp. TH156]|uniref:methionyl-tRNA formyltransferase n=1 Tax=Emticicia sp. TH156 TaxID=2067454 RepID=UPI001E39CD9B|nr:methionyl-tRNA formyltransferase [Emticicia sp. TH156]